MKKISCLILSFIVALSVGTVNISAAEITGEEPLYDKNEVNVEASDTTLGSLDDDEAVPADMTDIFSGAGDNEGDITSFAEPDRDVDENLEEIQIPDEDSDEIEPLAEEQSVAENIEWTEITLPELEYDDRYSLGDLSEISEANDEYTISDIISSPTSYQVVKGGNTTDLDEAVIEQVSEDKLDIVAKGVGTATIYLVPVNQEENGGSTEDTDLTKDGESNTEVVQNGFKINVIVKPATLTLMYLTGQSNMEGWCSDSTGQELDASIACQQGTVYSTYAPSNNSANYIAGITFSSYCNANNAADFVAGSLQSDTSITGEKLEYSLDTLTANGKGKTGPDSGLAYEWNYLTGDKVWVINTAWGGTNIASWTPPEGSLYKRSVSVWDCVNQVYQAEINAGHYKPGKKLAFWLQGEGTDKTKAADDYMSDFTSMYSAMNEELDLDALGIIITRSSVGFLTNDDELVMTGPRIAQYTLGGSEGISNVYVVSNANEQWVSDEGVRSYFRSSYPDGKLNYPMHNSSKSSLPTTVNAVHSDIHYSQIGHNENGITAAYGMCQIIDGETVPTELQWRNENGVSVSSLTVNCTGDTEYLIPVADPVYAAKQISYSLSGDAIKYDGSRGVVTATETGESAITASYNGNTLSQISVTVTTSSDLSGIAGKNYTGIYYYQGNWWYLVNGIIQSRYEGVEKNEYGWWYINNGKVDFSYTGFAHNNYGWWYIENGEVIFNKNSVIHDTNKKIDGTDSWWYVVGGEVQSSYTGVADYSNAYGWWYIKNGKVDFTANTVAKNKYGWWYVLGGQVQFDFTGLADYSNEYGWWYINNGQVLFNVETLAKNRYGWFYVRDSEVDFGYNGFAKNQYGWWYIEKGEVAFNTNTVIHDTNKKVDGTDSWWYIVGGEVQSGFTGLADYSNSYGWWYINNGKITFNIETLARNKYGWFYVKDSQVDFGYNGFAKNQYGWWYIEKGEVAFNANGVIHDTSRKVDGTDSWWYVVGGEVQSGYTGVADYSNAYGWWYIKNGKIDFSFNGVAANKYGSWYIQEGKVNFTYSGNYTYQGMTYTIVDGGIQKNR